MNVKPIPGPSILPPQTQGRSPAQAKAAAIAAFNQASSEPASPQPPQQVVQNQNSISPEEMTAIQPQRTGRPVLVEESVDSQETQAPAEAPRQEDPQLSSQFAKLARQEKALRARVQQQEQALKAREAELQAKEAELLKKYELDKSSYIPKDLFKQDAFTALQEAGLSYDDLTQQLLNNTPVDPRINATISKLESKIRELESANQETRKQAQDQQTQAYQAALKQIKNDVTQLVSTDPAFETVKATRSIDDVVELIEKTYSQDGVLLSVEEAAQQVEDYLIEEAMKLTQIGKIKQKLGVASQPQKQTQKPSEPEQPQMKTLTNASSSARKLSAKDRAILAFRGELNKG